MDHGALLTSSYLCSKSGLISPFITHTTIITIVIDIFLPESTCNHLEIPQHPCWYYMLILFWLYAEKSHREFLQNFEHQTYPSKCQTLECVTVRVSWVPTCQFLLFEVFKDWCRPFWAPFCSDNIWMGSAHQCLLSLKDHSTLSKRSPPNYAFITCVLLGWGFARAVQNTKTEKLDCGCWKTFPTATIQKYHKSWCW